MAHSVRAILLARAIAASFFGLRASRLSNQGDARPGLAKRISITILSDDRPLHRPIGSWDNGGCGRMNRARFPGGDFAWVKRPWSDRRAGHSNAPRLLR